MTRTFDGGPSLEDLKELGELALRAPSAGFSQGAHLLILVGDDLQRFWQVSGVGAWFGKTSPGVLEAQSVILVLADESAYTNRYSEGDKAGHGLEKAENWVKPMWLTDAALVTQNLLLLIEEQRWGALLFDLFVEPRNFLMHLRFLQMSIAPVLSLSAIDTHRINPLALRRNANARRPLIYCTSEPGIPTLRTLWAKKNLGSQV